MGWGLPRDLTLDSLSTIVEIVLIRAFQSTTLDRVDSAKVSINSTSCINQINFITKNQKL
jgi:hypothetical protein